MYDEITLVEDGKTGRGEEEGLLWLADCSHGAKAVLGQVRIRSRRMTESLNRPIEEQVYSLYAL
jgi:hypothetical protein